jgi:hypothetical protein
MFSAQTHVGVDPWVAASGSSHFQVQVSRAAAARHAVMEAVRERRNATRSARRSPRPARVETVSQPSGAPRTASASADELTPVG